MNNCTRTNENGFTWKVKKHSNGYAFTITVIRKAQPDFFLNIIGALTWNHLDIIDAKSFHQQSTALDVFTVIPTLNRTTISEKLDSAKHHLMMALKGHFDLIEKVRLKVVSYSKNYRGTSNTRVRTKNGSLEYTLINISTRNDFPGILFMIADVLIRCNVEICSAQIQTRNGQVEDTFYIRNQDGSVLNSDKQSKVKAALEHALP